MALLGRWTGVNTSLVPTASWTAPNALFPNEARNDSSTYGWSSTTSTITLPASDLADGYLFIARYKYDDASNSRVSIAGRFQQTGGTGDFVNGQSGDYSRNNNNNKCISSNWGFVHGPSASATIQFQWERESDAPTAGTTSKFSIDVIPLYYSNHGLYSGIDATTLGGITPNVVTLNSTIDESDTAAIERVGNVVTVKGNSKRYWIFSSQWYNNFGESGTTRTQRVHGMDIDGSQELAAQGYSYHRQGSSDGTGSTPFDLLETDTADRTIELTCYRGDGITNNLGGADTDAHTGGSEEGIQGLVVLELNDSAEVARSHNTATTAFTNGAGVDLPVVSVAGIDINDSASFVRASDNAFNAEQAMDAFVWGNVWAASSDVSSSERGTWENNITVDGAEDSQVFDGTYGPRGNQASEDCFAYGANPKGFVALSADEDIGVSVSWSGQDTLIQPTRTNVGTVGFGVINLDTMQAAAGETATGAPSAHLPTSSGVSEIVKVASSSNTLSAVTADGVALLDWAAEHNQSNYRFEKDDGSESESTFLTTQNTNIIRDTENPFRLRQGAQLIGDPPAAITATLQYKESGDSAAEWRNV